LKATLNWLKEFVDINLSPEEIGEKLTVSGSEVENIEPVPSIYNKIVVGKVTSVDKHPNADKLQICNVDLGNGENQDIVCGAPNVAAGQLVPVALIGAHLPIGLVIKEAKIRGVVSNGMICSKTELGISDESSGIMVLENFEIGSPFNNSDSDSDSDILFDIFINPNRPDCMSVRGIAREIAALTGEKLKSKPLELESFTDNIENNFEVEILDAQKCPRYTAALVKNIEVKPSPLFIQSRLYAVGIRPINNIVDATNYILIEWGHPLHAFDATEIAGNKIIVKTAEKDQKFKTLDNVERNLNENILMICDTERMIGAGGIMGGANSEIKNDTRDLILECAYFDPNNIIKSAKFLGLATEASKRFERGMDPSFCLEAVQRTSKLIKELSPNSKVSGNFIDNYPNKLENDKVLLRLNRLHHVIGTKYSVDQVTKALNSIDIETKVDNDVITADIPTFRHDLKREIDLIEEIPRVIGLESVEPRLNSHILLSNIVNPEIKGQSKLKNILTNFGFNEIMTYSFISSEYHKE